MGSRGLTAQRLRRTGEASWLGANVQDHGMSQRGFATLVGVSVKTLQNWEQGRRQPSGPAAVLLTVLVADPGAVMKAVR